MSKMNSTKNTNIFAEKLKKLRLSAGITQVQLANELNVSRSAISNYESGNREPDAQIIGKISEFFNVSIDYLMGKTEYAALSVSDGHAKEYFKICSLIRDKGDTIDISGVSLAGKLAILEYCEYIISRTGKQNN